MLGLVTLVEVSFKHLCTQTSMSTSEGIYQLLCAGFQTEVAALAQEAFV